MDPSTNPFQLLGGEAKVRALAAAFYEIMARDEPALTALHRLDPSGSGRVDPVVVDRFSLFLIGWLGGPQDYIARFGHPRLRMRHNHVPVDVPMRDAWLRAMGKAMDQVGVTGEVRGYLDQRFAEVADFMRNVEE